MAGDRIPYTATLVLLIHLLLISSTYCYLPPRDILLCHPPLPTSCHSYCPSNAINFQLLNSFYCCLLLTITILWLPSSSHCNSSSITIICPPSSSFHCYLSPSSVYYPLWFPLLWSYFNSYPIQTTILLSLLSTLLIFLQYTLAPYHYSQTPLILLHDTLAFSATFSPNPYIHTILPYYVNIFTPPEYSNIDLFTWCDAMQYFITLKLYPWYVM